MCSTTTTLFFKILRNQYLKTLIQSFRLENVTIHSTLQYVDNNLHYLKTVDSVEFNTQLVLCLDKDSIANYHSNKRVYSLVKHIDIQESIELTSDKPLSAHLLSLTINKPPINGIQCGSISNCMLTKMEIKVLDQSIVKGLLPPYLEYLSIDEMFQHHIEDESLPKTLAVLKLKSFHQKIPLNTIPHGVYLEIGSLSCPYDHSFDKGVLPNHLSHLKVAFQSLDQYNNSSLPMGTTIDLYISKSDDDSNPVVSSGIQPLFSHNNMKRIGFSGGFERKLKVGDIPLSVEQITFSKYQHSLEKGVLPFNLKELQFMFINQPLAMYSLPESIQTLSLGNFNLDLSPNSLPNSITSLEMNRFNQELTANSLPRQLNKLFMFKYNKALLSNILPTCIQHLELNSFNQALQPFVLPSGLTRLVMDGFSQPLSCSLPNSLAYLSLANFNQPLKSNQLPVSLKTLILSSYNQPILSNDILPHGITTLDLNTKGASSQDTMYNTHSLPSSITNLCIGYNHHCTQDIFSSTPQLEKLTVFMNATDGGYKIIFTKNKPTTITKISQGYSFQLTHLPNISSITSFKHDIFSQLLQIKDIQFAILPTATLVSLSYFSPSLLALQLVEILPICSRIHLNTPQYIPLSSPNNRLLSALTHLKIGAIFSK
ncbi:hypothetical protein CYY_000324 [Polysphondylium violaceum]|uniref:FNIP repeat-containing protein n=1 Tax=Polysphondylium violaceum TaxID=133409 RepID=A0A8J4Q3Z4_9MYCE|nr:hypothetical protein CYY_000324 [Polysphondylium violaceum]